MNIYLVSFRNRSSTYTAGEFEANTPEEAADLARATLPEWFVPKAALVTNLSDGITVGIHTNINLEEKDDRG